MFITWAVRHRVKVSAPVLFLGDFFLFTSYLNMQASIACVWRLVTCHLNEAIWQPALARVVVLNSWF